MVEHRPAGGPLVSVPAADGSLLPAQTIHDQNVEGMQTAEPASGPADIYLLGGTDKGVLRRYQLARGEATDVGRQEALPLTAAARSGWCGMQVGDAAARVPAIVAVDAAQPRLRVHRLGSSGWEAEETFPTIGGVKGLAAPAAAPGTLLLWAKDAADIHRCRWENHRLSYPQPWEQEGKDRKIIALDSVGSTVWWAQRVGSDLDLYVWPVDTVRAGEDQVRGPRPQGRAGGLARRRHAPRAGCVRDRGQTRHARRRQAAGLHAGAADEDGCGRIHAARGERHGIARRGSPTVSSSGSATTCTRSIR